MGSRRRTPDGGGRRVAEGLFVVVEVFVEANPLALRATGLHADVTIADDAGTLTILHGITTPTVAVFVPAGLCGRVGHHAAAPGRTPRRTTIAAAPGRATVRGTRRARAPIIAARTARATRRAAVTTAGAARAARGAAVAATTTAAVATAAAAVATATFAATVTATAAAFAATVTAAAAAVATTTRAALRAVGLPLTPRDDQLFSAERREGTESALREVYTNAQAAAAVICDRRGVSWARFGNALIVERLVATAAQAARHPATEALGRPVQLVSELFGVYGRHLIHLPGPDLWMGVTGSRECPALGLRLARLQLIGVPTLTTPPPSEAPELALDPDRSDRLGAWAARRGALAAAIFGEGDPASTDSPFAGACAPLVPEVLTAFRRVQRDGFAAGFTLLWRGEDDLCLVARVIDEGQTVTFARFSAPPSPRALDDLSATVRWLTPPMAAAS